MSLPDEPLPCTLTPEIFDVDASRADHYEAAVMCRSCWWQDGCLQGALDDRDTTGVRAGRLFGIATNGRGTGVSRWIRKRHPRSQPVEPCGTHAAFNRHRKRGEEPCEPCSEAEHAYHAARWARHKLARVS